MYLDRQTRDAELRQLIRKWDEPVLHQVCRELVPGEPLEQLQTMRAVCRAAAGLGLAAPQIGWAVRAVFIHPYPDRQRGYWMLNPVLVEKTGEQGRFEEGCLSFPGVMAWVTRPRAVRVTFLDEQWQPQSVAAAGLEAVVIQHELDHLDGICKVGDAWVAGGRVTQ